MPIFSKEALFPSQFFGLSPSGGRVRVRYTPKDIAHLNQRIKDMISAGLQIPVSKEHQSSAKPMDRESFERYQAERAWATCGWVQDGWVNQDGSLCLKVDIPDENDAQRVAVIRYVSPEIIRDYMDGSGRVWPGLSITHLAVTPRPVQHKQTPFEKAQARLSLSHPRLVRLSLGETMAEEYEDQDQELFDESDESAMDDINEPADEPAEPEPVEEPGPNIPELVELMREVAGVDIAGHVTTPDDFISHLYTAMLTKQAHEGGGMDEGIEGSDEYADEGQVEEVPSDVMMGLQRSNKALMARIAGEERIKLRARIDGLLKQGLVGKKKHQQLVQELTTTQLSLSDDGNLKANSLLKTIEAYETNDAPRNRTARLGISGYKHGYEEVPQPGDSKTARPLDQGVMTKLTRGRYQPKKDK